MDPNYNNQTQPYHQDKPMSPLVMIMAVVIFLVLTVGMLYLRYWIQAKAWKNVGVFSPK